MANCGWLFSILWFLVLIFVAFPLGLIAAFFYLIFSCMIPCCSCSKAIADFLHKGVQLPYRVSILMVSGKSCTDI